MCGLVGAVGNLFEKDKKMFECMLMFDTIRGPHSTGVARVTDMNEVQLIKDVGTPWDLIRKNPRQYYNVGIAQSIPRVVNGSFKVLMGHNRWATVGEVVADNAHPFQCGPLVGAHNGTLFDYSRRSLFMNEVVGTDSQALYENMAHNGIDDTFDKLNGAWALTWYNSDEKSFNIVRNKERPLTYAFNKKGDVMYYASEEWMIFQAAEKCGVDLENGGEVYYDIPVDKHMKWDLTLGSRFGEDKVTISDRKGYTPKVTYSFEQTPQKKGTVLPFPKKPEGSKGPSVLSAQQSAAYWGDKRTSFVEFVIRGMSKDDQRKPYIQCFSVSNRTEVRIYPTSDPVELVLEDTSFDSFTAKIKRVKFIPSKGGQCYITIDSSSIKGVEEPSEIDEFQKKEDDKAIGDLFDRNALGETKGDSLDDEIPFRGAYHGPRGILPSREAWEEHTHNGCAWCSSNAVPENSQDYHWMSDSEYLCEECVTVEEVMQYVPELRHRNTK